MKRALVALAALTTLADAAPGSVVRVEHRDPAALPSRGPSNAPVTIELFFTPGSQSRARGYSELETLQANHPSRIRLVYRILSIGGSARFPYAALEANAEGKFREFMAALHDAMTRTRQTNLSDAQLAEVGAKIGLDPTRLDEAIKHPPAAYTRLLDANERQRKQKLRSGALPNALFNGRPPQTQITSLGMSDLEREYRGALDLALDALDRGADPAQLAELAANDPVVSPADIVIQPGPTDEEIDPGAGDANLASPPLDLRDLPSFGPPDAALTIVIACNPTSINCVSPLRFARLTQDVYPVSVRVVWAPYFDVTRDDAGDLALLGDAALCAEQVGTSLEREVDFDSASSAGWRWVEAVLAEAAQRHRRTPPEQLIEKIAEKLHVERRTFASCRARLAGTTVAWIDAARHAGVHSSPSTIIGGRIYPPITDATTLQQLVEAELAPGWLGGSVIFKK